VADTAHSVRSMWTLVEPIHAVTYFAPAARSAYEQAGLRGFWRGYFAGRAAPLGPVGPAIITASFHNFAPAFVARAVPAVWELITPEEAVRTRTAGAVAALGSLLNGRESEVTAAADLLWQAVGELDCAGRVLAAGNVALPVDQTGSSDLARLWQAATVLREHRGDGHFAALATADIDGCEAGGHHGWRADQRRPASAHGGRERHRPCRGASLDPAGSRGHRGRDQGADPARAGMRERAPLPQSHRRARPRHGDLRG
jgi:hypothetical protein